MKDFTDEDVRLAVKRGVAWLDERHPDWVNLIDLSSLAMNTCGDCVIGQAVGDYYEVVARETASDENQDEWAIDHGFQSPDFYEEYRDQDSPSRDVRRNYNNQTIDRYYRKLEEVWTDVVLERENQ